MSETRDHGTLTILVVLLERLSSALIVTAQNKAARGSTHVKKTARGAWTDLEAPTTRAVRGAPLVGSNPACSHQGADTVMVHCTALTFASVAQW